MVSKLQPNSIYSVSNFETICNIKRKKGDAVLQKFNMNQALETLHPLPTINLTRLLKHVNSPDILRYIPNELLSSKQVIIKLKALEKYNKKKEWQKNKNRQS